MTPKRIQLRRTKGWRKPADTVVVARPSKWGNPHRVDEIDRHHAVESYRNDLLAGALAITVEDVRHELGGKDLACWCALDVACHADVLLDVANAPARICSDVRCASCHADRMRRVVLVEGASDAAALHTLAGRLGRDLRSEGVDVVPMGGATNFGHHLEALGPHGRNVAVSGLCDVAELPFLRRALEHAGFGSGLSTADVERLGFHVCDVDLEDELIRSLGSDRVEQVIDAEGELKSFRTFQRQPAQRDRRIHAQLRRFLGTHSGRKLRYAPALVEALDLGRVPQPLVRVLG